jgi:hypothetical protein
MLNTCVTQTVEVSTKFYEFITMTVLQTREGWRRATMEVLILLGSGGGGGEEEEKGEGGGEDEAV